MVCWRLTYSLTTLPRQNRHGQGTCLDMVAHSTCFDEKGVAFAYHNILRTGSRSLNLHIPNARGQTADARGVLVLTQFLAAARWRMSVNLSLSPEQAALLLPLLEQISSSSKTVSAVPTSLSRSPVERYAFGKSRATSPPPPPLSPSASGSECQYSTDDLLQRKTKNTKSNPAQNYLLVSYISKITMVV